MPMFAHPLAYTNAWWCEDDEERKKIENHGSFPFGKWPKAHLSNKKMQRDGE